MAEFFWGGAAVGLELRPTNAGALRARFPRRRVRL